MNPIVFPTRLSLSALTRFVFIAWLSALPLAAAWGQMPVNGGMEVLDQEQLPQAWELLYIESDTTRYSVDRSRPYEGENCLCIESLDSDSAWGGSVQRIKADDFAGKRVKLEVAIRVAESEVKAAERYRESLADDEADEDEQERPGRALLNIGISRTSDLGFWRQMALEYGPKKLISNTSWQRYSIVIDVPEEAEHIEVSFGVNGKTKAWFDNVSLEVVGEDVPLTQALEDDAPEPFFTWWLVLPGIAISLFVVGSVGDSFLQRFALRFTTAYWMLYFFAWWLSLLEFTDWDFSEVHAATIGLVEWFATNIFQKDVYRIYNGSGDTLFHYATAVTNVTFAGCIAIAWTCVDWRNTPTITHRDLWRSFLRYSVAFVLLSYGLAKLHPEFSQFPQPSIDRLHRTYGDSSPMGLLWTFMGASKPYTIFAGAGEVLAAVLLLWRRTTVLGAVVSIGVMANVVMLNLCYDVPVKLLSTHLLVASCLVLLPDLSRLLKVFWTHDAVVKADLRPPYMTDRNVWLCWIGKLAVIVLGIVFPAYERIDLWIGSPQPDFFGEYEIVEYPDESTKARDLSTLADGAALPSTTKSESATTDGPNSSQTELVPKLLRLVRAPFSEDEDDGRNYTDMMVFQFADHHPIRMKFELEGDRLEIAKDEPGSGKFYLPPSLVWQRPAEDRLIISDVADATRWRIELCRHKRDFLLTKRGFHWINRRPLNR